MDMNMDTVLALREADVDVEGALNRFCGNSALYEKFLLKFPSDDNFPQIAPALARADVEAAMTAVHTLKGVSGNLGMTRLYDICAEMTGLLRTGKLSCAQERLPALEEAYARVCAALAGRAEDGR